MTGNRLWTIGSLLLAAVILVGGWFVGVSPMLQAAAASEADLVAVEAQNRSNELAIADLKTRYAQLPQLTAELAALRSAIPDHGDVSDLLGEIDAIALTAGVDITDIAVSDAVPYTPTGLEEVAPETPAVDETPATTAATDESNEPEATTPTATTVPIDPTSVANSELVTASNFVARPIAITVDGNLDQVMAFVDGLQIATRIFLVTGLTVTEDPSSGMFSLVAEGLVYSLLDSGSAVPDPGGPTVEDAVVLN